MIRNKKGQMGLKNLPVIVVSIGLVFLVMATIAFIASKYGTAIGSDVSAARVNNETLTPVTAGTSVANAGACNFGNFQVVTVYNGTSGNLLISSGNYTTTAAGKITNTTNTFPNAWRVTYDYTTGGEACTVTKSLETEIANNTSIAGIILTISLVGVVLTVLMGIFLVTRVKSRA